MRDGPLRGYTVLVIEDEDDYRDILRLLVESLGAHVVVAADGLEGLQQMARRPPDLILCDLTMPILDGFAFARRIRADRRYQRVLLVAVTARGDHGAMMQTRDSGFDAHLVKPVTLEALRSIAVRVSGSSASESS